MESLMNRRRAKAEEALFRVLMVGSTSLVLGSLLFILGTVIWRGLPALNLAMLTQTPKGGYYLGKEGGILNAIVGSLCLAAGATILALLASLPIAIYLQVYAARLRRVGGCLGNAAAFLLAALSRRILPLDSEAIGPMPALITPTETQAALTFSAVSLSK